MHIKLTFLGATKNVTGSRILLETNSQRILVDCGLYQERELRIHNWERFAVSPASIDCVILTHAHIDHSGLLPKLVKEGFRNRIYCTAPTADIAKIMLLDSARLQEHDAEIKKKRHNREGRSGPYPEVPLYTEAEVEVTYPFFYQNRPA
jgi:metallo-beta-lactamase family protein